MGHQLLAIDTDDLTVAKLANWLDQVRSAGAIDDQIVGLDATDAAGEPVAAERIFVEIDR